MRERGVLLRATQRPEAAKASFEAALAHDRENVHAHYNLANLLHYHYVDHRDAWPEATTVETIAAALDTAAHHYETSLMLVRGWGRWRRTDRTTETEPKPNRNRTTEQPNNRTTEQPNPKPTTERRLYQQKSAPSSSLIAAHHHHHARAFRNRIS